MIADITSLCEDGFPFKFSAGEIQVRLESSLIQFAKEGNTIGIRASLRSSDEIIQLLLLNNALQSVGAKEIHLTIPYVPYSRQDRVCYPGEAFGLKVFADLINSCKFTTVRVWDPHSVATEIFLDNCVVVNQVDMVDFFLPHELINNSIILAPDKGAVEKAKLISDRFKIPLIQADKVRDPDTGEIKGILIQPIPDDCKDRSILVVDDICDGGRTFVELAKELKAMGVTQDLYLYVTHGIFSKGLSELAEFYNKIYTANIFDESIDNYTNVLVF